MQNPERPEFGVSPAYFVSLHGEDFGPDELCVALPGIHELGYVGYQAEIFQKTSIGKWSPAKTRELSKITADLSFRSDIFVAHFLGHEFTTARTILTSESGLQEFNQVLELTQELGSTTTVAVPALPLEGNDLAFSSSWAPFVEKVHLFAQTAAVAGVQFAIEPVPGGLVSSSAWFERLRHDLKVGSNGSVDIHYLLDTGNTWASGEPFHHITERLHGRIAGTHLCDVVGPEQRSAEPGTGNVKWAQLIGALKNAGYDGSFDVEIACSAADLPAAYKRAREYLCRVTEAALRDGSNTA